MSPVHYEGTSHFGKSQSIAPLERYMQTMFEPTFKHPSQMPRGRFFPDRGSAPRLYRSRVNRILTYNGSFNPPHKGHLRLLRHTFDHGVHGLNVIAAIIIPAVECEVVEKCREAGGSFAFGHEERCMLWQNDQGFPDWAWAYQDDGACSCYQSLIRLQKAAGKDGFQIEFVTLIGPCYHEEDIPPDSDNFNLGADTLIISDAARVADFQRPDGSIGDFDGFTPWARLRLDEENLLVQIREDMQRMFEDSHRSDATEVQIAQELRTARVDRATLERLESVFCDMKHILYCQPSFWWQPHHVRFVKAKKDGWNGPNEYTSSSELRAAMSSTQRGDDLKTSLEKMALSPHILWQCRAHWRPQAKARKNDLITLDPLDEWDTEVLEAEALKEEEVSQLELARSSEMEGNQENGHINDTAHVPLKDFESQFRSMLIRDGGVLKLRKNLPPRATMPAKAVHKIAA